MSGNVKDSSIKYKNLMVNSGVSSPLTFMFHGDWRVPVPSCKEIVPLGLTRVYQIEID